MLHNYSKIPSIDNTKFCGNMIRLIRGNNVQSLVFKRCLFVPSNSLTNKRKRRIPPSKPRSSNRKDGDIEPYRMADQNQTPNTGSIARLPAEVKKELKDLRSFTKVIAQHLKPEQENDSLTSAENQIHPNYLP